MISADGLVLGTVAEMFIDSADWRIEAIRVELRKRVADRIGAPRSLFRTAAIELSVDLIQSVSDAVVLAVDIEHLREAHRPIAAEGTQQPAT